MAVQLFDLFLLFLKISIFSFGGGYVLVGYLQNEITSRGLMSAQDFLNIVSISQMTPGPVGINAATFVGFKTAGYIGAIVATLATVLVPFLIVLFISIFYQKYKSNQIVQNALLGIRPACAGLIIAVGYNFLEMAVLDGGGVMELILGAAIFDPRAFVLFLISLIVLFKTKLSSIWVMLACMVIGIFIF